MRKSSYLQKLQPLSTKLHFRNRIKVVLSVLQKTKAENWGKNLTYTSLEFSQCTQKSSALSRINMAAANCGTFVTVSGTVLMVPAECLYNHFVYEIQTIM